jgi:hypothetical protein
VPLYSRWSYILWRLKISRLSSDSRNVVRNHFFQSFTLLQAEGEMIGNMKKYKSSESEDAPCEFCQTLFLMRFLVSAALSTPGVLSSTDCCQLQ